MTALIQPANAVYATVYLLNMDVGDIEDKYQKTAATIVEQLKLAQRQYVGAVYKKYQGESLASEAEERLSALAETANHLASLLSKESQERLMTDLHIQALGGLAS